MATDNAVFESIMRSLCLAGEVRAKKMMGEYVIYFREKVIGDICDNRLLIKQTPASVRLLPGAKLDYPYEGSKTLMLVIDNYNDTALMYELFNSMYDELPEKKTAKKNRKKAL